MTEKAPVRAPVVAPTVTPQPSRRLAPDILCDPQKKDLTRKIKEVFK